LTKIVLAKVHTDLSKVRARGRGDACIKQHPNIRGELAWVIGRHQGEEAEGLQVEETTALEGFNERGAGQMGNGDLWGPGDNKVDEQVPKKPGLIRIP